MVSPNNMQLSGHCQKSSPAKRGKCGILAEGILQVDEIFTKGG